MALKLKSRELPAVEFRAVLPEYLGPGGECFVEVDARAGGPINPAYIKGGEDLALRARVMDRKSRKIESDEEFVKADSRNAEDINRGRFGILYDACVIEWRSNIQTENDKGEVTNITCDRDTFLALYEQRGVPELATAMIRLEREILDAGKAIAEDDEETAKN
jgi:hypothetical protein